MEQLEDQRPLLADAETVCEQLCDILSDSASKTEIKNKLNTVEKQYNNLNRKMSKYNLYHFQSLSKMLWTEF